MEVLAISLICMASVASIVEAMRRTRKKLREEIVDDMENILAPIASPR